MNRQSLLLKSLLVSGVLAGAAFAQPTPAPTSGDLLCSAGGASPVDTSAAARLDTVVYVPDADGFFNIFDGKTFKGWWQNCRSSHSSGDRNNGAIWRIDTNRQAIYSTQRNGNVGGLLSTKKRYLHYEIVFETWAGFGNDAGFFHRNRVSGRCYQTVLDYLSGASFGGTWGEGGFPSRDHRPFSFNNNDTTLSMGTAPVNWTSYTASRRAAGEDFDCPTTGCTQANWRATWKPSSSADGWNTVRIKFYGGTARTGQSLTTPGADRVRMRSWYKSKTDTATSFSNIRWIPIWGDSIAYNTAQTDSFGVPNPIAFQVHGGGRFGAVRGTWYRNIRIRELDSLGNPLPQTVSIKTTGARQVRYEDIKLTSTAISGKIDLVHEITVTDLQGRVLSKHKGPAGAFAYNLPAGNSVVFVQIKTSRGAQTLKVNRFQ